MMRLLASSCALLLLAGCAQRVGSMTVASSKNLPPRFEILKREVRGEDCGRVLILVFIPIPLGSMQPKLEEALDRAIEQVPNGNLMTDVVVMNEPFIVPLLLVNYISTCMVVTGDVGRAQ
jgi:hypothetical protein